MKIVIKGGRVIDPANGTDGIFDVFAENGKILAVGKVPAGWESTSAEEIDADGKVVCPGFIDIHMHEDSLNEAGGIAYDIYNCMLNMGVTTAIGGNCGSSKTHPVKYLDIAERDGAPVNVGMLAGHGYFRYKAGVHDRYSHASTEQREIIRSGISEALGGGCLGISFGVRYYPGTDKDELYAAASAACGTGKFIAAHVRDDAAAIFSAIDEIADVGKHFALPVQISHIGSMAGFGQMSKTLDMIDSYRAGGLDISMDCYPYDAFSTSIGSTTYDDGWLERYGCGYDVLEFCDGPYRGQRADPETFARMRRDYPAGITVCHVMREDEVRIALAHPMVALGSDGMLNKGQGHPRAAGTFPRFIKYCIKGNTIPLTEGIRKMTYLPACRLGISDKKGTLTPGADADITVFDPENISDNADFANPALPPSGISAVIIGGRTALLDGKVKSSRCGTAVRR